MNWTMIKNEPAPIGVPLIVSVDRRPIGAGEPFIVLSPVYYIRHPQEHRYCYFELLGGEYLREIGPECATVYAWTIYPEPSEDKPIL